MLREEMRKTGWFFLIPVLDLEAQTRAYGPQGAGKGTEPLDPGILRHDHALPSTGPTPNCGCHVLLSPKGEN